MPGSKLSYLLLCRQSSVKRLRDSRLATRQSTALVINGRRVDDKAGISDGGDRGFDGESRQPMGYNASLGVGAQQQPVSSVVSGQSPVPVMARARLDGEIAALNTGGWSGRSVVIGTVAGVTGAMITSAVAAIRTPEFPAEKQRVIANRSPDLPLPLTRSTGASAPTSTAAPRAS